MSSYAFSEGEEEWIDSVTFLLPCRRFNIGYTVSVDRKLPVVDEFLLRLLFVTEGLSLEQLQGYFGFSTREMQRMLSPLVDARYVTLSGGVYSLRDLGTALFSKAGDAIPRLTQIEFREGSFRLDMISFMPVAYENIGALIEFKRILVEVPLRDAASASNSQESAQRSFSKNWNYFLEDKGQMRAMKDRKLKLYKTEYVRSVESYMLPVEVTTFVDGKGGGRTWIGPLGEYGNNNARDALLRLLSDEANRLYGDVESAAVDALCAIAGSNCFETFCERGLFQLKRYLEPFGLGSEVTEGNLTLLFGSSYCVRNYRFVVEAIRAQANAHRAASKADGEGEGVFELEILWVRPTNKSWGRSVEFLRAVDAIKGAAPKRGRINLLTSLVENTMHRSLDKAGEISAVEYSKIFDRIMSFRSDSLPRCIEIVLVRDVAVMVLAHVAKPENCGGVCPVGFFTQAPDAIANAWALLKAGGLRTRPNRSSR